jgi:class 3 adenylate cyclase/tetratricopeptide (TPR) repeat protein
MRVCANCGAPLSPTAKFCSECAHPAGQAAAPLASQRFGAPETYTPRHLAEKILTSKAALHGERKHVTVLFADLRGSMELLADRDPEDARRLLDPVLEHMMNAVHRYEGTVNQVMGDGIMALFGAPLAHEDHAVRACYAALRMQQAVKGYAEEIRRTEGLPIHIRVGLNSGEVVVRSIGSDLHMDYTAVGQTTHLAARMEQMATPGSILIPPQTLTLVEGYVLATPLGAMPVKGLEGLIEVYEVTGAATVRSRFDASAARGLTRFVGRDGEMEQLRQALDRAGAGHGQVAAVIGEPGVGKSRLFWEIIHSQRTQGWLVVESSSLSYGKATAFLPLIDLLRAYFRIEPRDEARQVRDKVTSKLFTLDRALEPSLPGFLWLLDIPVEDVQWEALEPAQRRQRALDGVKRLLLRESQVQPVLLVFEDLHWIDPETQAFIDSIVESLPAARLLLLVNYRPEYRHGWSGKTYYRQLRIDALPPESADELLGGLLGSDPGLEPLKTLLIERTEGNPFFLEESVRTLAESRALAGDRGAYRLAQELRSFQIPATAQAILAARIDRLSPEDKWLLQAAAVVGKDVPFALLQAIANLSEDALRTGLAHLTSSEFLYEARLFPDVEYTFKHALVNDVAYGSLLHDRRRALHADIVDAIETLYRERLGEQLERLAHHAVRGGLRERAVQYLLQAGRKATARSALPDARDWFEQVLRVLETLPESQSTVEQAFEIRFDLRSVLNQLGELRRTREHLREAGILAERLHDERRRGRVEAFLANIHSQLGELDEARAGGTRALAIAQRLGDLELRFLSTSFLAQAHYYRGDFERVVELTTDNLSALPADWVYRYFAGVPAPASVYDLWWLVMSLAQLGRFVEAAENEAEAIRLAAPTQQAFTVGVAHAAAGTLHILQGDWAKARAVIEHGLATIRAGNVVLLLPTAVAASAWVLAQLGETTEAQNRLQEGEELVERQASSGFVRERGSDYHSLGRACLVLGRLDEARRLGECAVESSPSHPGFAAHARQLLGDIATHPSQFDAESGEAHYRQAMDLARPLGMRPLVAHCHLGLGKLHRRTGKADQARDHLGIAVTMYREMDMRSWLEQTGMVMTELP